VTSDTPDMLTPEERARLKSDAAALRQRSAIFRNAPRVTAARRRAGGDASPPAAIASPVLFPVDENAGVPCPQRRAVIAVLDFCAETLEALLALNDPP